MTETLYRFYDSDDRLLYVGVSSSFTSRAHAHSKNSQWFEKSVRVTLEHHPTREAVLEAEKFAIKQEDPLHNKIHSVRNEKPRPHFDSFWDVTAFHQDEWHDNLRRLATEAYFAVKDKYPYLYADATKAYAVRAAFRDATNSGGNEIEGLKCESCELLNAATFFETLNSNFWLDAGGMVRAEGR
jgi:predicted GIY-YIG superfamily endonuclease